MTMTTTQTAVVGAGPAGLAAALALAHVGIEVAIVAPPHDPKRLQADGRTTALFGPSIELLRNIGVWRICEHDAAPISAVRIADDRDGLVRAPEALFRASELGLESFGANIANPVLLAALDTAASRAAGVVQITTSAVTKIAPDADGVTLELTEGGTMKAALVVAADGRNSIARAAAGIAVQTWTYPQAAIATSFRHARAHSGIVNELHRPGGPLTTVPLPGPASSLVWVEEPEEARRLAGLDDNAFATVLEERLLGVLGALEGVGPRALYPLSGLRAERMGAARIALVGEAAHVMPPIGAQGLNLGLRDAAALAECVAEARESSIDIAGPEMLAAYARARSTDVLAHCLAIDLLNRSLLTDFLPLDMARGLALHLVSRLGPLRRLLMQRGMAGSGPLPRLMRPHAFACSP